jgi:hypothetical protein
MNPNIMRSTLTNALNVSDSYVWLYTEDMNWFKKGAVSDTWIDAVADARSAYSIRLANQGVWEGKTGYNNLNQELTSAPNT